MSPVADTLAAAFFADPVWSWVFPDPSARHDQLFALWHLLIEGALSHEWVWTTPSGEAATVWIPPSEPELSGEYAERLNPLLVELRGPEAGRVDELFERFEQAHPHEEHHFYLSLFGTHPQHRGHGAGMNLLRSNLEQIDRLGFPAYLESTNPINIVRYRSVGFEVIGAFELSETGPEVTQMWRTACNEPSVR